MPRSNAMLDQTMKQLPPYSDTPDLDYFKAWGAWIANTPMGKYCPVMYAWILSGRLKGARGTVIDGTVARVCLSADIVWC